MVLAWVLAAAMQVLSPDGVKKEPDSTQKSVERPAFYTLDPIDSTEAIRFVTIDNVVVVGNRVTKSEIILRELDVAKGQVINYEDLLEQLKLDQQRVNNLRLFNTVEVQPIQVDTDRVLILVEVTERWYIFPVPIFDLIDRNFNVWWEQQDRDLSRVNYGLRLYQRNFRGRNEKLRLTAQFGYTKKFGINYSIPYLDKSQRHGLIIDAEYKENKNIAVRTVGHIQEFREFNDEILLQTFKSKLEYVYRPSFQSFHFFGIKYENHQVNDIVTEWNPNYFRFGSSQQRAFTLNYTFVRDKRDVQAYPLRGYYFYGGVEKTGIGIFNDVNLTKVDLQLANYFDLKKNWYFSNYSSLTMSTPDEQPYFNYQAVGYRSKIVRGYELYLIEGPHFFINKSTIKKRIFSIRETIGAMPLQQFRHFPLDVYLKTYFDWGYVRNFDSYDDNIRFSDTFLGGTGIGLDIHTLYDMVIRLEYSVNKEMEKGFFFHLKKEF